MKSFSKRIAVILVITCAIAMVSVAAGNRLRDCGQAAMTDQVESGIRPAIPWGYTSIIEFLR